MEKTSLSVLKEYWGYDKFRPLQEEIIHEILIGNDTLALMPTGGGKSICFQVPALLNDGICIVISPLIALMKDQVENLRKRNIPAIAIFSGMSHREVDIALDNCIFGNIKFLYLAPERLYNDMVQERIRHMKVNLFAIDEAHCISQWGYDFRPSYLELIKLRELQPKVPILALTATATPKVVADIQEKLGFKSENVLSKSFRRENLAYMVFNEENKMGRMLKVISKIGGTGIVYVRNRRETQEVARYLLNHGIPADFYHAGLDINTRSKKQEAWTNNQIRVIVATNAFGMGIDKPDVRFVIHLDIPDSLEAYYQEAGRAGRDGKKAYPVLLYQQADRNELWENIDLNFPDFQYIQQVYHHLCNYFQIAYGAGKGLSFDFDVLDFAKRYKLEVLKTLSAFKFLERDKWLTLSEAVYIPARLKFEVDFQELYKFQVQSAAYDPLIKTILRLYGGVFDYYVPINEFEIAKKISKPLEEVQRMLKYLQQQELVTYIAKTDSPQLQFLQGRVDYKNLYIDTQFIEERKVIKEEQIKAIYQYLDSKDCRSLSLQHYFGEEATEPCGVCDLCVVREHKVGMSESIEKKIQFLLLDKPRLLHDLIEEIEIGKDEDRLRVLRNLLDTEKVKLENDLYHWNAL
ncbi:MULTISPECIES: RecQ family ATP-dependent DNA helicase [Sphingobacterium]|uniref:ATP-dependent DNA helicase RecQ n=1 Tax=Sphingobacterium cellulitidis TaxID=1768011 RepID=A0A8H9KUX5_9SPHI|nr:MULTISPECIES: ATP-dependent DNA helicase RecQ [Sphingobacterium]MBA8988483.1 ATP-dependent DNA helicase RecQ [Sphingobacterium soli]OYD43280.1 recombinase RecQ [Sphingobacterium cellulitidis]OYD47381.1 recombinase RecQ [Sphingobacterium cellulitidis]WFB62675.1 RecQ family ATP-dependent DNA helicase [Sphingobacterium sp. WM]GGE32439.1 ATP-dependent DNA helicase RecQ [Sphingobacterium soli]